jgi:hypothetical protein
VRVSREPKVFDIRPEAVESRMCGWWFTAAPVASRGAGGCNQD